MDEDEVPLLEMSGTDQRVKTMKMSEEIKLSSCGSIAKHQSLIELSFQGGKKNVDQAITYA